MNPAPDLPDTEEFVESRGGSLWTTSHGDPTLPTVLLCNGGPGCCDYLAPVADLLDGVARVIRWEQSGCGRSSLTPPYDIGSCLADMESIRRHYGVGKWIVGGHSWGADLALMYALANPEPTIAFFCLAGGRFHNDREWHRTYAERREAGLEPELDWAYPPNRDVNREGNASWKTYIQRPGLWRDLARLDRPGLFVYGAQDIRPSWPVEQVAALLPRAELVLLPDADHYVWKNDAGRLAACLRAFTREHAGDDS